MFLRNINETTDKVVADNFQVSHRKGSVKWDTQKLLALTEKRPELANEILQCRNEGEPTAVISTVKKKKYD